MQTLLISIRSRRLGKRYLRLTGLMDPVETGLGCGSDTAHMSIFGYDPIRNYAGRGSFETMGAGLYMIPGDIAFKCNFATLDDERGIVTRRRVSRKFYEWGLELCKAIDGIVIPGFEEYTVNVLHATEHRCGVRVRGPRLSHKITGTDPLKDNLPLQTVTALDCNDLDAAHTARLVNALSEAFHKVLTDHPINVARVNEHKPPANSVLLRGCGIRLSNLYRRSS